MPRAGDPPARHVVDLIAGRLVMGDIQRVLVVGGSLAGLRAAESLRKSGFAGEVTVASEEPYMPYNRPPLSKSFDDDGPPEWLAPGRHATDIGWRLGETVVGADLTARSATFASGESVSWSGLVVASGLRPRKLDIPGPEAGRHALRSFDEKERFGDAVSRARSLVVIGAGFIGCEVAAAAASRGVQTHVVAPESVPIERPLGSMLGAVIQRRLEAMGVRFHLGTVPVAYTGDDTVTGVRLDDGKDVPADLVLEAVGSSPNVEWLDGNELDLSDGVVCDERLRVEGRSDVVACGDVARFPNPLFDAVPRRVEHWMMAVDSAKQAGQTLGGFLGEAGSGQAAFAPVPSFWSHQESLRIQSFGAPGLGGDDVRVLEGDPEGDFAVGYHRDGVMVGVVLIGLTARYGAYRKAITAACRPAA